MKKLIFILAAILSVTAASAYTPPDSCLQMRCPDDWDGVNQTGTPNPDSVMVDSCDGSPTYGKRFAKRYFGLKFTSYPFQNAIQPEEIKSVSDLREDISGLKDKFQILEQEIGNIRFKRFWGNAIYHDSVWINSGIVTVFFDLYQDIEEILTRFETEIDSLVSIHYVIRDGCEILSAEDYPVIDNKIKFINPNPVNDKIYLDFQEDSINEKIRIYTMDAQLIHETSYQSVIDVSFLQDGVYYFTYNNKAYKFIKIK